MYNSSCLIRNPVNKSWVDQSEPVGTRTNPPTRHPSPYHHPHHGLQPVTGRVRVWASTPGVQPVSIPNYQGS